MSDEEDTADAWWAQAESEQWQRHLESLKESRKLQKEIQDGIGKRHDPVKIPAQRGLR